MALLLKKKGLILPDWPQTHYLSEDDLHPPAPTSFWNHRHTSPGVDCVVLGITPRTSWILGKVSTLASIPHDTGTQGYSRLAKHFSRFSQGTYHNLWKKNLLKIQIKVRSKDSSEERIKVPTRPDDKNRDFCVRPVVGTGKAHLPLQACLLPCEAGCWDCSAPRIQGRWALDTQSVPRITPATGIHPSIFMLETGTGLGVTSGAGRPWSLQSLL